MNALWIEHKLAAFRWPVCYVAVNRPNLLLYRREGRFYIYDCRTRISRGAWTWLPELTALALRDGLLRKL